MCSIFSQTTIISPKHKHTQKTDTMTHNIPNYTALKGVDKTINRIRYPPRVQKNQCWIYPDFEHYVGSFMCTMLKHVFNEDYWIITPEMSDSFSKRRPDLTVHRVDNDRFEMHAVFEYKKRGGDRFENALNQAIDSVQESIDLKGENNDSNFEVFIVIQRGLDIGFFEYHNDRNNLDAIEQPDGVYVPNFRGATSLTQSYNNTNAVIVPDPQVKYLYYDSGALDENNEKPEDQKIRMEADEYNTQCVFNLLNHKEEINKLFHHIKTQQPRSSL